MPTPTNRTPLRVARGTYSNLNGSLTDLQEGEITFATDEGKLYVKQGAALTSVSSSSQAAPTPSDVTASPAFVSGAGTAADPFVITSAASPFAGGTLNSTQQITIANANPGDLVVFTDNSVVVSDRFKGQEVGTVNSAGNYSFKLNYTDTPNTTTDNTTYAGSLQVGSVHFQWTVVQSALAPLSQATATSIATSGLAVGNTITATAGTAAGGTSPYTYAVRWERSFNGTSGWFDTGYTGLTYTIVQADAGYYVRAVATASDSTAGSSGGPLTFDLPSVATSQININSLADITNVVLAEDDTTGARFTSKNFSADAAMNPEGVPTSTKAVKVKFSGTFVDYPATDNVTAVTDNDPADIAFAASNTSITRLDSIGQYYNSSNAGTSTAYSYQPSMRLTDGTTQGYYLWGTGAGSAYGTARVPKWHRWYNWDGPIFPADTTTTAGTTASEWIDRYYKPADSGDTSSYYFYNQYGTSTTIQYSSHTYAVGAVETSTNETLGFIGYNSESTYNTGSGYDRLFFLPINNSYAYELQNCPSTYNQGRVISTPNIIGVPSDEDFGKGSSDYYRFFPVSSKANANWSSTYTDVQFDDMLSDVTNSKLSGSPTCRLIHSNFGEKNPDNYVFLYYVRNTSVNNDYDHLLLWISKDADETVGSNWNSRFITASGSGTGGSATDANVAYVDGSGRVCIFNNGTNASSHISTDFGATFTSTTVPRTPTRTNISNINDNFYSPYYTDGHWFMFCYASDSGTGGVLVRASNNNGVSWFDVAFIDQTGDMREPDRTGQSGPMHFGSIAANTFYNHNGRLMMFGEFEISHSKYSLWYLNYDTTLTLAGTQNLTGLDIQVGDTLRQGSATGVVTVISGSTVKLGNVNGIFSTGSPVQNTVNHSGGSAGTLYAIVGGSGAISDLQSSDPGFVNLGSNPNITLSLPATFPTGNTPDVELPSGTTLQVTVQATNSSGSDTLDSNIITPS